MTCIRESIVYRGPMAFARGNITNIPQMANGDVDLHISSYSLDKW